MAFRARKVTVGTTPTLLTSVGALTVTIVNNTAVIVYLGGADVTTATGYPLIVNAVLPPQMVKAVGPGNRGLYGIVATGTAALPILESGVV